MKVRLIILSITTLVLGGVVGAGVTLLMAPRSGRATRAMLRNQGVILQDRVADEVKIARAQVGEKLDTLASEAGSKVSEFGEKLKETVSSISIPVPPTQ